MGYVADLERDPDQCHEGWVAMTYADGKISAGASNYLGHYVEGYEYLPADPNDARTWGRIDPAYLRPNDQVTGWLPVCECGWRGIEVHLPDSVLTSGDEFRDPSDEQEQLVMDQWRLHLRYDAAGKAA
jgi:hypothetical protein